MARLTDDQIAAEARAAGFEGSALVTAVAVALAESGGRTDARGDVGLQDARWGPSVGLWQIRSLNAQRGTGGVRDEIANLDPLVNAAHAYAVSGGGANFRPWTTFTVGSYRPFLDRAAQAASNVLGGKVPVPTARDLGFGSRLIGPNPAPVAPSSGLSGGGGGLFDALYRVTVFGALAVGAMVLVALGGWKMVSPRVNAATSQATDVAAKAAVAA